MKVESENYLDLNIDAFIDATKTVLTDVGEKVALHEPYFGGNEWKYVKECLDTRWVSSVGKYVNTFEGMLADFTGVKHAVAVVNGTAALHICLLLSGVEPQDEVIIPDLTFIATANAVMYCGAIPHLVDVSRSTLGLDPDKLADYLQEVATVESGECMNRLTGRRIKAVVAMHTFGHSVDLDALFTVCEKFKLQLVEDAAEALGTYYKGNHTGNRGLCSALSLNGNKIITTGGGGAILTNDEDIGRKAKHITTTAKIPHPWAFQHDLVGYNYRLPNINAALGCAQIEQLKTFLLRKRDLAEKYRKSFRKLNGIDFFNEPEFSKSNYWLNAVLLREPSIELRDSVLEKMHTVGILARPVWNLMHTLPMFKHCPKMDTTTAETIEASLINIPSSVILG